MSIYKTLRLQKNVCNQVVLIAHSVLWLQRNNIIYQFFDASWDQCKKIIITRVLHSSTYISDAPIGFLRIEKKFHIFKYFGSTQSMDTVCQIRDNSGMNTHTVISAGATASGYFDPTIPASTFLIDFHTERARGVWKEAATVDHCIQTRVEKASGRTGIVLITITLITPDCGNS